MEKLKVAILGPGKIGEFHAREFDKIGWDVVAILTSSPESSIEKAKKLKDLYGINARGYSDLDALIKNEKIDAVSICVPSELHSSYVRKCLEKELNIFCEKPFVYDSKCDNYKTARELIDYASKKGRILSVNTQLVSILDFIPEDYLKNPVRFSMYMEPPISGAINLMAEAVPHMNSLLIRLKGKEKISRLRFHSSSDDELRINFNYGACEVQYEFKLKKERPRTVKFGINGVKFERKVGENYSQGIEFDGKFIEIDDPLKISIQRFTDACLGEGTTLVDKEDVLENVKIQDILIKGLLEAQ